MKKLKLFLFIQLMVPALVWAAPPPPKRGANPSSPIYTAPPQPGYNRTPMVNPPESPIPQATAAGRIDIGKRTNTMFSEANAAAVHWLNLNDAQAYRGTWLDGGGLMKDIITEDQWAAGMRHTRISLGPVHSRKVSTHAITSSLPYSAKGNFMIIRYDTRFQRMAKAIETITLSAQGPLGLWKVIGYNIELNR